jgi:hypothetical protein
MNAILSRLRKLEEGLRAPIETEAGRRAREANDRLNQRLAAAEARMKAWGYESPEPPELTETQRAALSRFSLGQRIRYHAQRQREWIAEIDGHTTAAGVQP